MRLLFRRLEAYRETLADPSGKKLLDAHEDLVLNFADQDGIPFDDSNTAFLLNPEWHDLTQNVIDSLKENHSLEDFIESRIAPFLQ